MNFFFSDNILCSVLYFAEHQCRHFSFLLESDSTVFVLTSIFNLFVSLYLKCISFSLQKIWCDNLYHLVGRSRTFIPDVMIDSYFYHLPICFKFVQSGFVPFFLWFCLLLNWLHVFCLHFISSVGLSAVALFIILVFALRLIAFIPNSPQFPFPPMSHRSRLAGEHYSLSVFPLLAFKYGSHAFYFYVCYKPQTLLLFSLK